MFKIGFAGTSFFSIPFFGELSQNPAFDIKFILTKDIEASKQQDNLHNFLSKHPEYDHITKYTPKHPADLSHDLFGGLDAMIVVAYGYKIPPELLKLTKWINLHGSCLPLHRGAAPIQYSVLRGEGAGLTAITMNEKIDQGAIISQLADHDFTRDDTFTSLATRLMKIGPTWFIDQLKLYLEGHIKAISQSGSATSAPSIKPTDRVINWHESATNVRARIHALSNFPCCTVQIGPFRIKPLYAILESREFPSEPGTLLDTKKLVIACKQGAIRITQLIPENGKTMSDEDFCRGRKLGDIVRVDN